MRKSTIAKHRWAGTDSAFALALGNELRRLRQERGLCQADLAWPLTRAFVCSVEKGRVLPSLAALVLLTSRLGVSMADFFHAVNEGLTAGYTAGHGDDETSGRSGRFGAGQGDRAADPRATRRWRSPKPCGWRTSLSPADNHQ